MPIPEDLQFAIDRETKKYSQLIMREASSALSHQYRNLTYRFLNDAQRLAYLTTRMPATFAAIFHILKEITRRNPSFAIHSLLDLGAGPGTVMWAASEIFPLEKITLIEQDRALAEYGQRLATPKLLQRAQWLFYNLEQDREYAPHDLVVFSYSIGEVKAEARQKCIERAWLAAKQLLIIVEPGTPLGFERIHTIRNQLLTLGAHIIAPCPHNQTCPMTSKPTDWCHFATRVARTALHRQIKQAELGYEDEKFCYLVFSKAPFAPPDKRILRHPLKRTGHISFALCTQEGLKQATISKKMSSYKAARDLEWGANLDLNE